MMYPYTKKKDRNIAARFAKDMALIHPVHNTKETNATRDAYITNLVNKPDFVKTYTNNDKLKQEPLKKTIASFSGKDIFLMLFFAFVIGGISLGVIKSEQPAQITKTQKAQDAAVVLALALIGLGLGGAVAVAFKQVARENAIDGFYHRLTVRYFYKLKKIAPDVFKEDVLINCNPEMMRVITVILMANMSKEDTKKIQEIAVRVPCLHDDRDIETMKAIEADINVALKIIEKSLADNPELGAVVRKAYSGYIPATFVLNSENQNTK